MKKLLLYIVLISIMLILQYNSIFSDTIKINSLNGNSGKRWAICIGINNYEDPVINDLLYPASDTLLISEALSSSGQFDKVFIMTDNEDSKGLLYPRKSNILRQLEYLKDFIKKDDLVLIYFSGHGINTVQDEGFLLCADTTLDAPVQSGISLKFLNNWISTIQTKKGILIVDACREIVQQKKGVSIVPIKEQSTDIQGFALSMFSTSPAGFSYEDNTFKQGIFSHFFYEGILGFADMKNEGGNGDFLVSMKELSSYVEKKVMDWAINENKKQIPYTVFNFESINSVILSAFAPETKLQNQSMVFVKNGTFLMGDSAGDGEDDEKPVHKVTLSSFYMSRYEITVGEFRKFVNDTKYVTTAELRGKTSVYEKNYWSEKEGYSWKNPGFKQNDNHPVVCVSWYDVMEYCNYLSKKEGLQQYYQIKRPNAKPDFTVYGDPFLWEVSYNYNANGYRLPTEAEWEYAARGGFLSKNYSFSGSNNNEKIGWHSNNSNLTTNPVGLKLQNELGLYDMSGNVAEWCWDWYASYPLHVLEDPLGPSTGSMKVIRGGGWNTATFYLRIANRGAFEIYNASPYLGFRIVRNG